MAGEVTNKKIEEIDDSKKWKFTETTIKKLEEAFSFDSSVEEACFYANISKPTYYGWIKNNKELAERFNALRQKPILLARQTVVNRLGDSYGNAMDYLSRKRKDEFSTRQEVKKEDVDSLDDLKKDINKLNIDLYGDCPDSNGFIRDITDVPANESPEGDLPISI